MAAWVSDSLHWGANVKCEARPRASRNVLEALLRERLAESQRKSVSEASVDEIIDGVLAEEQQKSKR